MSGNRYEIKEWLIIIISYFCLLLKELDTTVLLTRLA
jgi:hypothetical protein